MSDNTETAAAKKAAAAKAKAEKAEQAAKAKAEKAEQAAKAKAEKAAKLKAAKKSGKVIFIEGSNSFEVKGKTFRFQGKKYTAEEAVKNEELMAALIAVKAPSIEKV